MIEQGLEQEIYFKDIEFVEKQRNIGREGKPNFYTREEEKELFREYKNGNKEAGDKLILSQLKLVRYVTDQFKTKQIPKQFHDDLISAGNEALFNALKHFNPEKGGFATWARRCITTHILLYISKINKFEDRIEGKVVSGNKIITNTNSDGETELFDLVESNPDLNDDETLEYRKEVLNNVIADLPLRDREICLYHFFEQKKKKDLPYLLTPIYRNEWENIHKYGTNKLRLTFKTIGGDKYEYNIQILAYHANNKVNEKLLKNNRYIEFISHKHRTHNTKFEMENFVVFLNDVVKESIKLNLNGKIIDFSYEDNKLEANLSYNTGFICSDINSRLQKTLDVLRSNPSILNLMEV